MNRSVPDSTATLPVDPARSIQFKDLLAACRDKAVRWLLNHQHSDGHWCAELQGDTILETEYYLYLRYMGFGDEMLYRQLADYVLSQQNAEGGWGLYPGGPSELSGTVKAYVMLKAMDATVMDFADNQFDSAERKPDGAGRRDRCRRQPRQEP